MIDNNGSSISLNDIKNFVRNRTSIEFTGTTKQVNLDNPEIQNNIENVGEFPFPPLHNKQEIFRVLWQLDASNDSLKWDYITLLTYLNEGKIFYSKVDNNHYLVTIEF